MKQDKIDINKYEVYVFDVDGTLYYQNRLRVEMIKRLILFCIKNPLKIFDLRFIKEFRKLRENSDTTDGIYTSISKKYKKNEEYVSDFINYWMYENPLSAVAKTKDERIIDLIVTIKNRNKKVVIWSDYKADDKLKVLNVIADGVYTADDERVKELKPSPKALQLIMDDFNVSAENILMIGDRDCKDGEASRKASVDYVILPKNVKEREKIFNQN